MSKITFRADDDLVERLEALDTSKSEVMREALRAYLDDAERREQKSGPKRGEPHSVDDALAARIDALIAERLDDRLGPQSHQHGDLSVTVTVDGVEPVGSTTDQTAESADGVRKTAEDADDTPGREQRCEQCGESVDGDHVYCPNCGEKASHQAFCECGDEIRSDWAFCPSCGRRTPAADVLDRR
jgi:Arc/MetJ-type ribon-helix-helix transcriptional regulator